LVIVLDITGSMMLTDGGPNGETRLDWACARLRSALEGATKGGFVTTVLAVGTGMKPVVIDTDDIGVVYDILDGLPLGQAFERGYTDLYGGLRESLAFCHRWDPGSTTMVIVTDGDTGDAIPLQRPAALERLLFLGAGSGDGRDIGNYRSRQKSAVLSSIAEQLDDRLSCSYINCSSSEVPAAAFRHLSAAAELPTERGGSAAPALTALGAGLLLSVLPLALLVWGSSWCAGVRPAYQYGR
jgi:hypothetical protein